MSTRLTAAPRTIAHLIQLHCADLAEVGTMIGRSKRFALDKPEAELGSFKYPELTRERLIDFAKARRKEGAGSVTTDLGYLRIVLIGVPALHGIDRSLHCLQIMGA